MSKIFSSASKIVLLVMALAVVAGLFLKIVSEETFKTALLMVFTFYFANKGNEENQFLGK
jgi:hypothetical protein